MEEPTAVSVTEKGHAGAGHRPCIGKFLFSAGIIPHVACNAMIVLSKDVYVLTFGADAPLMGVASTSLALLTPVLMPLAGYLLDGSSGLQRLFPSEKWGRRAPWFLTHSLLLALATAALWTPPSMERRVLCAWFFGWALLATWLKGVVAGSWDSALFEIFATKEQRSEVIFWMVFAGSPGFILGVALPLLVTTLGGRWSVLFTAAVATAACGLTALLAVPEMRRARMLSKDIGGFAFELFGMLKVPVVRYVMFCRLVDGFVVYLGANVWLYFLTFVECLTRVERGVYTVIGGAAVGASSIIFTPIWAIFMRRRRETNANLVHGASLALGCLSSLPLLAGDGMPRELVVFLWIFLLQGSLTGMHFWRAVSLGWVVDEDCHCGDGKRREALLVGLAAFFNNGGRALAIGTVMLGLSAAGMDMENCDLRCKGRSGDCVELCDAENIAKQPGAVRDYALVMVFGVLTAAQLLQAALVAAFPVRGARLEKIYAAQAELEKEAAAQ